MSPLETVSTAPHPPNTVAQKAGEFLTLAFGPEHRNKLIARALDISPDMAKGLRNGKYWTVDRIDQIKRMFGPAFVDYVFGEGVAAAGTEQHWWATDRGMVAAPAGHEEYFRRSRNIPATMEGEFALVAMRNHGWLAVTKRGDRVEVRHNARMMSAAAGRTLGEWLHKHADEVRDVRRIVEVESEWLEASHRSAASAVEAIEGAATIAKVPARPWKVERVPVSDPLPSDARALLHAHEESPSTPVVELAAKVGIMDRCSILRVADDVVPFHVGSRLNRLDRRITDEPIGNMADAGFAAMVRQQMREITGYGAPVVHRLSGSLNGEFVEYVRPALPERTGAGSWHVLSFPHILEVA